MLAQKNEQAFPKKGDSGSGWRYANLSEEEWVMEWDITPGNGPLKEFERIRSYIAHMDRILDVFFEGRSIRGPKVTEEWGPLLDVSETGDDIVVKAEIPGMDPDDINISLTGDMLTIKGEKKPEKEKEEDYHIMERNYGTFTRSVRVPTEVQNNKISATYKNGILKIVLPKSEKAKKKEIKIRLK
jgi:HSP20 family protein